MLHLNNFPGSIDQAKDLISRGEIDSANFILYRAIREHIKNHASYTPEDKKLLCTAHRMIASTHFRKQEHYLANENHDEALKYTDDLYQKGLIMLAQSEVDVDKKNIIRASERLEECYNYLMGDQESLALHSALQGNVAYRSGQKAEANHLYREALTQAHDHANRNKIEAIILKPCSLIDKAIYWFWCKSIHPTKHQSTSSSAPH